MTSLGDEAIKLIKQAKRSNGKILPYDQETVRNVLSEISEHSIKLTHLSQKIKSKKMDMEIDGDDESIQSMLTSVSILHYTSQRNHRCLMAYHQDRLGTFFNHNNKEKLVELGTQLGPLPIPEDQKEKLQGFEIGFLQDYAQLARTFNGEFMEIELAGSLEPPINLFIEARVIKDCGKIMTENGPVLLQQNTLHYLRRTDVEHFISQGKIKEILIE